MAMDLLLLLNIIVPIVLLVALIAIGKRIKAKEGIRTWLLYLMAVLLLLLHGLLKVFKIGSSELQLTALIAVFILLILALLSKRDFGKK
ncbi:MAG: hypothetical protein QW455_06290 [Archaeoglobaceae archaeon]